MLIKDYDDLFDFSINNPELFWDEIAQEISWDQPYSKVLEDKLSNSPKWFVGGELNISYNCLDKHVEDGFGDEIAVIHDSPVTGSTQSLTYKEMLQWVELLAGVLNDRCGMKKGDIVLLYFPVIPECLISMLACTRIGLTYVVVYGGFSTKELSQRIEYTEPKLIITCNVGPDRVCPLFYKEKIDAALAICKFFPQYCIVYNRPNFKNAPMKEGIDLDWRTELFSAKPHGPVSVASSHPLLIIYTSGTSGEPKVLVHSTGGFAVQNKYFAKYILEMKANETFFATSDFGWILGQSLMTYGTLLIRGRTVLYEGKIVGPPDNAQFARVLNWHKVERVICPPTLLRVLKQNCSKSDLELTYKGLHSINVGGEISDPQILEWTADTFGTDVYGCWGQTELAGGLNRSSNYFRNRKTHKLDSSILVKTPGLNVKVVDRETGQELPSGTLGRIVLKLPTIASMATTIYKNHDRFVKSYFQRYPGYFDTMDAGVLMEDGSFRVESRDDDIINVGAARICGSAVEEACLRNKRLTDALVVPLADIIFGNVPFAFLIPSKDVKQTNKEIIAETINIVKDVIGDVACFQKAVIVPGLPRTISGKMVRQSLIAMIHGRKFKVPATVVNAEIYQEIYKTLVDAGFVPSLPLET